MLRFKRTVVYELDENFEQSIMINASYQSITKVRMENNLGRIQAESRGVSRATSLKMF